MTTSFKADILISHRSLSLFLQFLQFSFTYFSYLSSLVITTPLSLIYKAL
nr:MAG TPA: hypothetical protein [Caudoviricetes sp.]